MEITFKMIEAFGNILHTPGVTVVPPEFTPMITNTKWGVFRENTPDACRYVDLTFTDGKVLRFVTQNRNKRYEPNNPKVQSGQAQAGQLKPYAIQAMGGAQITWVIANPYAPNNQQAFLGHVYNGAWKPKQDNAYTPATTPPATTNVAPGTYVPTQPDPTQPDPTMFDDPSTGMEYPTADEAVTQNPALDALMPMLMQMLKELNSTPDQGKTEEQHVTSEKDLQI